MSLPAAEVVPTGCCQAADVAANPLCKLSTVLLQGNSSFAGCILSGCCLAGCILSGCCRAGSTGSRPGVQQGQPAGLRRRDGGEGEQGGACTSECCSRCCAFATTVLETDMKTKHEPPAALVPAVCRASRLTRLWLHSVNRAAVCSMAMHDAGVLAVRRGGSSC